MILFVQHALAAEPAEGEPFVSVGLGGGIGLEIADKTGEYGILAPCKLCPPTLHVLVPVRFTVSEIAALRLSLAPAFGIGQDEWSFLMPGDEEPQTLRVRSFLLTLPLTAGPEVTLPIGAPLRASFGGGLGLALTGVFHSQMKLPELLDAEEYDYDALVDPWKLSPYTIQPSLAGNLFASVRTEKLWFELDYAMQYLRARSMEGTNLDLSVERAPLQWNTLSLSVGVAL